jgi:hypothetical protein
MLSPSGLSRGLLVANFSLTSLLVAGERTISWARSLGLTQFASSFVPCFGRCCHNEMVSTLALVIHMKAGEMKY